MEIKQYPGNSYPIKVLQFGEGNFLRGFVDNMIDIANEKGLFQGSVAIVKPIPYGSLEAFREQDCRYTTILRGRAGGETAVEKRVVTAVSKVLDCGKDYAEYLELAKLPSLEIIVSNTTEAGIVYDEADRPELTPPVTYPGKLTRFLLERFRAFDGDCEKGLILIPVELIEHNGAKLKECVLNYASLWMLPEKFIQWVNTACTFCETLVDRIITGYPRDEADQLCKELGYEDNLLVTGETFALWVIQTDRIQQVSQALPLDQAGLPVIFTDDQTPYRERKVRILNGAHTGTVLAAYLAGLETVGECMEDGDIRSFLEHLVYEEIAPTVPLPMDEVHRFADSVMERFENPFIRHYLLSIALNSVSKWKSRILPSLRDSITQTGKLPPRLCFSLAALLAFYSSDRLDEAGLTGMINEMPYQIMDDRAVLEFFAANSLALPARGFVQKALANTSFWGEDLTAYTGLADRVCTYLEKIRKDGARAAINSIGEEPI